MSRKRKPMKTLESGSNETALCVRLSERLSAAARELAYEKRTSVNGLVRDLLTAAVLENPVACRALGAECTKG